jgi:hypothetical protein
MKKPIKISLWVLGSLVALIIIALVSTDMWVSSLVRKELRKSLAQMPGVEANVGRVYLNLISGSAIVKDITFATNTLALEDSITGIREPGLALHIPTLSVWNVNYLELIKKRRLTIFKITVDEPKCLLYMDEQHPEKIFPTFPKDTTLEKARLWLEKINVQHVEVNKLCAKLHSTISHLALTADSLSVKVNQISYNFLDSVFAYNDSVYDLSLAAFLVTTPDSIMAFEMHDLNTANQRALNLGYTRFRYLISPKKMADKHHEPTTWIDIELNKLTTSALNPIRKALTQDATLESLNVDVKRMHVVRDARYAPKHPFGTPQEFLRHLPLIFQVKQISALVNKIDIEFFSTDINCGQMHLKKIRANLSNVTNRPGAVWHNHVKAPFGDNGNIEASFDIHMDKASSFDVSLKGKDIETHDVNSFLRPLVGMTCDCHIDDLDAAYKGDKDAAQGEFCMQYHGLNVMVYKEDNIPYKVVTKNAGTFTQLANTLIPKSNPTAVDIHPRRYEVEWKRDEWKPYPLYVFGPCIDGVIKTMLPGLFVHKQTKAKK